MFKEDRMFFPRNTKRISIVYRLQMNNYKNSNLSVYRTNIKESLCLPDPIAELFLFFKKLFL